MSVNHCVVTWSHPIRQIPPTIPLSHFFPSNNSHLVFPAGHLPYNSLFMPWPAKFSFSHFIDGRTALWLCCLMCVPGVLNQHKVAANFSIGLTNIKKFTISLSGRTKGKNGQRSCHQNANSQAYGLFWAHNGSDFSLFICFYLVIFLVSIWIFPIRFSIVFLNRKWNTINVM